MTTPLRFHFLRFTLAGAALFPVGAQAAAVAPDGKVDFEKQIQPIFAARCYECHGPKKQKGKLRLDDRTLALNPKKKYIVAGDVASSQLVELISLPADDADVMPNEGDPLTKEQIETIKQWIAEGAEWPDTGKPAEGHPESTPAEPDGLEPRTLNAEQSAIEEKAMQSVQGRGALALRVAQNTNVVDSDFSLLGAQVTDADVALLRGLEPTLVWLNLSRTSITDAALEEVARYGELRRLNLSNTKITDAGLAHVARLTHLQYLNLYGTPVSDAGLQRLRGLSGLRNLYLWQTQVTDEGVKALKAGLPNASIDKGDYALALPDPNKPINGKCPISGKDVSPGQFSIYEGQAIGFCCPDCKAKFDADPKAFVGSVAEFKAATVAAQKPINAKCPISGKDVSPEHFSIYEGQAIAFCCTNCKAKFDADPKAFVAQISELKAPASTVKVESKPGDAKKSSRIINALCPLSGKPASDRFVFAYRGQNIGFCCDKCLDQFAANPAEFAAKVPELKKQ